MGTRADFYVGVGKKAKWIGSIGWDGYPSGIPSTIKKATTSAQFRKEVTKFLSERDDATLPESGWPWPWEDSSLTDYAYAFSKGKVMASCFGDSWFNPCRKQPDKEFPKAEFPNMADKQNVTFGKGSGLIVITSK